MFRWGGKKDEQKPQEAAAAPEEPAPPPDPATAEKAATLPDAPADTPPLAAGEPNEPPAPEPAAGESAAGEPDQPQGERPASYVVRRRPPPKRKVLVLWSGGLDSTYTLVKLLKDSHHDVYAHHVIKKSRTDDGKTLSHLGKYEARAVRLMQPWIAQHFRPFAYSESAVDLSAFPNFARDMVTSFFFGAQAAMTWGFQREDKIFTGENADEDQAGVPELALRYRWQYNTLVYQHLVQAVMGTDRAPDLTWLNPAPTRQQQADELPPELYHMAVCCRDPKPIDDNNYEACGVCVPCVSLSTVRMPMKETTSA